jgi:hypothetical protein
VSGILDDADGPLYVVQEYRHLTRRLLRELHVTPVEDSGGAVWLEYDDGNGLWISLRETPSDQGFSPGICPQE